MTSIRSFCRNVQRFDTSSILHSIEVNQNETLDRVEVGKIVSSSTPDLLPDQIQQRVNELYALVKLPPLAPVTFDHFKEIARKKPDLLLPFFQTVAQPLDSMLAR